MKILILADSRGMWPRERNWPGVFSIRIGTQHEVNAYVSGVDCWLGDLHMMENHLLSKFPGQHFDLIIHQGGWHEGGPCFWPAEIWSNITNTPYRQHNPAALTHPIVSLSDGKNKNLYIDRECEQEIFEVFKKYATRVMVMGLGALRSPNALNDEYKLGMEHHYAMLESNDVFMNYGHDQLNMPMDDPWINENTGPDRIHYNAMGSDQVSGYLSRYIKRFESTLSHFLTNSITHLELYKKSVGLGSAIASRTNKGDVVLIAKDQTEESAALFWGCILYGRIPLIKKVLRSQIQEIKDLANIKFCICEKEDEKDISTFIPATSVVTELEIPLPPITSTVDDLAFIQIVTTGGKHEVSQVTHKAAIEQCVEYGTKLGIDKDSKILSWLFIQTNGGIITSLLMPIIFDCQTKLIDQLGWSSYPENLLKAVSDFQATHVWAHTYMLKTISYIPKEKLDGITMKSIKHLIDTDMINNIDDYTKLLVKLTEYGLGTDVLSRCFTSDKNLFSVTQSDGIKNTSLDEKGFVSCGRNILGNSILIMNEKNEDISESKQIGKILVRSGTLTTKPTGPFGYMDTGFLGFMEEGELFVTTYEQ